MYVLFCLLLLLAPAGTSAGNYFNPVSSCHEIFVRNDMGEKLGGVQTICMTVYATSPTPWLNVLPNGTQVLDYKGEYSRGFAFYRGIEDNIIVAALDNPDSYRVGPFVKVSWTENGCNYIKLDGQNCRSCEICRSQTLRISADCRNHPSGRLVECEDVDPIFFPLANGIGGSMPTGSFVVSSVRSDAFTLEGIFGGCLLAFGGVLALSF